MRVSWVMLLGAASTAYPGPVAMIKQTHVRVPMRDRVQLVANIYRPQTQSKVPVILLRTPYNKEDLTLAYDAWVEHGYAVMVEDVRGRYESEGVFTPMTQESADADDTLNWLAQQSWCDGKVGMIGGSYLGIAQWKAALLNNPHLKAIFPVVSGYDDYRDRFYSTGGALKLGHRLLWLSENIKARGFQPPDFLQFVRTLPLRAADRAATGQASDIFQKALDHPSYDSYWESMSTRAKLDRIHVPVFSVGGWYDNYAQSDLEAYAMLHKHSNLHRVLIGPWPHNMSMKFAGVDYGKESGAPIRTLQMQWFDQWLKGKDTPLMSKPPVRIFVMGANRWREEREWPLAKTRYTPFYLSGGGHANSLDGDGRLSMKRGHGSATDGFLYDPRNPTPTMGGAVCCNPKRFPWGPIDQRPVERRRDVLVYTSEALDRDLEVTGPVTVLLWAATSAKDTDFTVKLVDVFPDGQARNLTDGILRLRYRDGLTKPVPANPGEVYRLLVDAGVTSNVFLKGHRIRVEISSSNFPRFDRNPNTGRPVADETELKTALQTVYHDKQHPSAVVLPVIP